MELRVHFALSVAYADDEVCATLAETTSLFELTTCCPRISDERRPFRDVGGLAGRDRFDRASDRRRCVAHDKSRGEYPHQDRFAAQQRRIPRFTPCGCEAFLAFPARSLVLIAGLLGVHGFGYLQPPHPAVLQEG